MALNNCVIYSPVLVGFLDICHHCDHDLSVAMCPTADPGKIFHSFVNGNNANSVPPSSVYRAHYYSIFYFSIFPFQLGYVSSR